MVRPKRLYKYRSLDGGGAARVEQSLFERIHFFDSPSNFNDPFECLPSLIFERTPAKRFEYLIAWYMKNAKMDRNEAQANAVIAAMRDDRPNLEVMFDAYRNESLAKLPMICLSAVPTTS